MVYWSHRAAFPADTIWLPDGNFELLGGPIGSPDFCNNHTAKRVEKATAVLKAIGELPDPQVALLLLRYCASFGKMVYSARVVPPEAHSQAMSGFDNAVRECFESFSCLRPDDTAWKQATLASRQGGLGLRSLVAHGPAAFLASGRACRSLCQQLDSDFLCDLQSVGSHTYRALRAYNASVSPENAIAADASGLFSQQTLSRCIDDKAFAQLKDPSSASLSFQAHLGLVSAKDASRWLHAAPAKDTGNKVEPAFFTSMLQRRLRLPIFDSEHYCPLCDGVVDVYADHCLVCCGGGDRTKRHNLLRNLAHNQCLGAGFSSELERPGLLRPRPLVGGVEEDGTRFDGPHNDAGRRPADVYVPRWRRGAPACLDFAVTSGLRTERLRATADDAASVTSHYEGWKCGYLGTQSHCQAEGMVFIPMIIEAHGGGWGTEAAKVWSELAKTHALASGELRATVATRLLQSLAITLHRENARAILRRTPRVADVSGSGAAAAVLAGAAADVFSNV